MTRATLIANPAASRTSARTVAQVEATLRRGGWQLEVRATGGAGDARRFAAEAVAGHADVVVVFGGDGTTMQAAAALVGSPTALGIIPGGTGNLLAGNLRVPRRPARAAEALLTGRVVPLDLGRMERADGVHYFAVACGAGYDARVMTGTSLAAKQRWRFLAYVGTTIRLLPRLRSATHRITVDGVTQEARAALVVVANCGEVIPPHIRLRSGIAPDDGLLDVIVLRADGLAGAVCAIWTMLREAGSEDPGHAGYVRYARGRCITVESEPIEPVQLDGESHGLTPFTASIVPGAINVIVPRPR